MHAGFDAADDATDDTASASDTPEDPGDEEVDVNEAARLNLEERVFSGDWSNPLIFSLGADLINITGSELAGGAETPDHTGDPPSHEGAISANWDAWADDGNGQADDHRNERAEAPHEPGDEVVVDVVHISGIL